MTPNPPGFEGHRVAVTEEMVRACFPAMKRDSGPGHPWVGLASTKGGIIDRFSVLLVQAVMETLDLWGNTQVGALPQDPVELCKLGAASPIRVFVKNEPHDKTKISTGKVRLIAMVPIHMVIAEMLICSTQNLKEIAHWDQIPSKPGLGLAEDSQIRKIWDEVVPHLTHGVSEADVSGFDFCLSEEMFIHDATRRVDLIEGGASQSLTNAVYNMHHVLTRSVFALSDGRMYAQETPGIMKSGRYVTSATNSFIRVMLGRAIGADWVVAMGDDSLESTVDDAVQKYEQLGIRIKFYRNVETDFEFCSHTFIDGVAWPAKPGKMFFNLLNQKGDWKHCCEQFQQWFFEMRHHPDVDHWVSALERSGWATQNKGKNGEKQDQAKEKPQC